MGNLLVTRAGGTSCLLKRRGKKTSAKPEGERKRDSKSVSYSSQLGEPFLSVNTLNWVWRNELKRALMFLPFHFKQQRAGTVKRELALKTLRGLCTVAASLICGTTKSLSLFPSLRPSPSHFLHEPNSPPFSLLLLLPLSIYCRVIKLAAWYQVLFITTNSSIVYLNQREWEG